MINEIYKKNKELDKLYEEKYGISDNIIKSNKLELMLEISELLEETKCFKYWKTCSINKENIIYEYSDLLMMILYFFNKENLNIKIQEINENIEILDLFIKIYDLGNNYINKNDNKYLIELLNYTYYLKDKLNITLDEIYKYTINKINKTIESIK